MQEISQHLRYLQEEFFPFAEKYIGPYTEKHEHLCQIITFVKPEQFIVRYNGLVGRPVEDRAAMVRAFIAKAVYNLTTTRALIDRLQCDPVLSRICGWEKKNQIPSESTFSRAFAEFANMNIACQLQEECIKEHHSDRLIGHISRDSTAISAREKAIKKIKEAPPLKKPKKTGRPNKGTVPTPKELTRLEQQTNMTLEELLNDLPTACDVGCKKNSKGYTESWKGFKLHIDTADGDIPISAIITSASVHDSQVALPLARITSGKVTYLYEVMDAAYDAQVIRDDIQKAGRVALIDYNHRSPNDQREFAPHEKERYKVRSSAERVNSNLKDNFGGSMIRVRGAIKIFSHLMFGLLALTIEQTIRLLTPDPTAINSG